MADLNVFEITNIELNSLNKTKKVPTKKSVKESVRRTKRRTPFNIPANKLKVESIRFFEENEDEVTADYTPDDDVVLVIDPEMEETPEDAEDAEEAAEDLVGDCVCKCAVCGANYVCDCDSVNEDLESEEDVCPVCGEEGEQIVVGTITATDELSDEDEESVDDTDFEEEEEEDEDSEDVSEDEFDDFEEDDSNMDSEDSEDDEFEESIQRAKKRTARRRMESTCKPMRRVSSKSRKVESKAYNFDESTFNRMLTKFAKENYSNVKFVKINSGVVRKGYLTLEGTVISTKGNRQPIKFVSEKFVASPKMSLKFKEYGPFTNEAVGGKKISFILDCLTNSKNIIQPVALKYSYKVKERKDLYSVSGKVLKESLGRPNTK